jgi:cation diffusion facilitator CzcD-associated flavoprotein CzcO
LRAFSWFVGIGAIDLDSLQRRVYGWIVRKHLETVKDPELRGKLTPTYPPLCKRPVMSGDFYKAVQRPDVTVIASAIDHIESTGVVTPDGTLHEVDVLALATGFEAHAYMRPMKVVGRGGVTIDELWSEGVFSYRTIGLPGFPNMFMIMGPNTGLSHVGVHETEEWQAGYIIDAIRALSRTGVVSITPSQESTDRWLDDLREALPNTIWMQCTSWYTVGGRDGFRSCGRGRATTSPR